MPAREAAAAAAGALRRAHPIAHAHKVPTPSARCRAIRRSAVWPRVTWCGRSTPSTASWARAIDRGGIQFRVLNRSKGPAVRGPRAQADRKLYRQAVQAICWPEQPNLDIRAGAVEDPDSDSTDIGKIVTGVVTRFPSETINAGAIVLTTGTFLNGLIHRGEMRIPAGRVGGQAPALKPCSNTLKSVSAFLSDA